ncbi:MAG TPA: methyltransferase domain-containing protein [Pirellulaceae bacterium]|nr:methyltransferase domain-containing protein [Pirellulaceae bacterium]
MSNDRNAKTWAFGVEPGRLPYRLRQARYQALGEDVGRLAREHFDRTRRALELIDVGTDEGVARRYIEAQPGGERVRYHGVDLFPEGMRNVYKRHDWKLTQIDLEGGMPGIAPDRYDVVICEQVLEHLHHCEEALGELVRVLRPGGMLIVGVPIFPHGIHALRQPLVNTLAALKLRTNSPHGHVQAFSKRSFLRLLEGTGELEIQEVRGFRIISGGPLRGLEYCRWWWLLNRRIGRIVPSLCVEIQVVARKKLRAAEVAVRAAA